VQNGDPVSTGIFKEPVAGRVMLRRLNLDSDGQADLSVHGGPTKAVYVYPSEHYDYWTRELPGMLLPWGMFGENFTTMGLLESQLNIGDKFHVGSATVIVTEPRMPCYKLGIKFRRLDIVKSFSPVSAQDSTLPCCKRARSVPATVLNGSKKTSALSR
jgi:MOSC domain-containing protein YiiM